jgi:glycosyltransferase involved in cell wall biosynthesis
MALNYSDDYMTTQLSICIPTYNRDSLLREALDSLLIQDREGLEIVICDNASPDSTLGLVEEYQCKFRQLSYFRWPENVGVDRNFLKTVEIARGEYCWFLGDDDQLDIEALDHIFTLLDKGYGLIYVNAMSYDSAMFTPTGQTVNNFNCDDADQTLLSLSSWISFASSLCFRRADFMKYLDIGHAKVGTNLVQCYPVLKIMREAKTHIVKEPLVKFRAGNTGGYGIFRVFITEFGQLMEYCKEIGYSHEVVSRVKTRNVYQVIIPALLQIKLGKLNLTAESIREYLDESGLHLREKILLTVLAWCPARLIIVLKKLKKQMEF